MKKLCLLFVLLALCISGCVTSNPKLKPKPSKIMVYRLEEGRTMGNQISVKDNVGIQIDRAVLTTVCGDWIIGNNTLVESYLYDTEGNQMSDEVIVSKPEGTADCWRYISDCDPGIPGSYGHLYAKSPGGLGYVRFTAGDIIYDMPLYVYQTWRNLNQNTGVISGPQVSTNESECFLWNDSTDVKKLILKGKSYFVADQPNVWYDCQNFVDIKTVDMDLIETGEVDRVLDYGKIYVGQVPGGFVKLFYFGNFWPQDQRAVIFEFSPDGNFL